MRDSKSDCHNSTSHTFTDLKYGMKIIANSRELYISKFLKVIPFIVFLIASIAFVDPGSAMFDQLNFEHITSVEGLSHDTVYSIVQDKSGYLWFGTEDGLNKYDGYEIEVYRGHRNVNSIGNANCAYLYVDDTNSIWIASWGGGIEVLDQENGVIKTYMNDPSNPNSLSDNNVHHIFEDSRDILWFGTYTKGLNRFDRETGQFKSYMHNDSDSNSISDDRVWWISEDTDGTLLLGTNKGLDKFDPETEIFTHYSQIENRVRTIYFDTNNTLWLGTQKGLCTFDTATGKYKYYLHDSNNSLAEVITSILEDSYGNLWIGNSNGVDLFDRGTGLFTNYCYDPEDYNSITNNDVRVIFEDQSANLWIGTRGGGINKIDIKPRKFTHYDKEQNDEITLSDINVLSVFQGSDGVIWVGSNNGGLNRFDLANKTQEYFMTDITKEENRNLSAICEDTDSIWVGSLGGLNRINKFTGEIITYKNDPDNKDTLSGNTILSLLTDSTGTVWVGTLSGLNRYNDANDQFVSFLSDSNNNASISSNTINCLYEDTMNNLWIGTQSGLNSMNLESGLVTRFIYNKEDQQTISDNIIHCIFEDSLNNIWIGTQYGLNRYDKETNAFISYTTEDGLPNNCIRAIREDASGKLWMSTNNGISSYSAVDGKFTNYNELDGLQGNGYNNNACETTVDGMILFGGTNGLDFFDPENIVKSSFIPSIVITGFRIMDKEYDFSKAVKETGKVSLTYTENNISISLASLDFTMTDRNQYAYKLENFDSDWNNLGNENTFSYTNIPSGNYELLIKATNSDGIWAEQGISLKIHIAPPWWLSTAAYITYLCATVFILYMIILYFTKKQKRRSDDLYKMLQNAIQVLSKVGEMRDVYTSGHQRRVQKLSCAIASAMGLSDVIINNIYVGSLIHDIGKITIASEYLNKPGKLTDLEYQIIQTHVMNGYEIIKEIDFPSQVTAIVSQHHERLDGNGYPNGISGDQIIIESRIVAVADVVEAMSTDRPYRPALGIDAAIDEITKYKGIKYDTDVVNACTKLIKDKGYILDNDTREPLSLK